MIIQPSEYQDIKAVKRPIYNGSQFNKYFTKPAGIDKIFKRDGCVDDTVKSMLYICKHFAYQSKELSKLLAIYDRNKKIDVRRTAENVFNFVQRYVKYKLENGEKLRSPFYTWEKAQIRYQKDKNDSANGADCDCMSIFCGCIFQNLGIKYAFRIAAYKDEESWQHVYTVVYDNGIEYICDPVINYFNQEKPYKNKKTFSMNKNIQGVDIHFLGDLGEDLGKTKAERQAKRAKRKAKRKERKANGKGFFRKVGKVFKKVEPTIALSRGAFLAILAMNFRGFATRLSLDNVAREKFLKFWDKMGGSKSKLLKKINKAAARKALFGRSKKLKALQKAKQEGVISGLQYVKIEAKELFQGLFGLGNLGGDPVTAGAGATAAAATPFITKAMQFLKDSGIVDTLLQKGGEVANDLISKGINRENLDNESENEDFSQDFDDDQELEFEEDEENEDLEGFTEEEKQLIGALGKSAKRAAKKQAKAAKKEAKQEKKAVKKQAKAEKKSQKKAIKAQKKEDKKTVGKKQARQNAKAAKKAVKTTFKETKKQAKAQLKETKQAIKQDFKAKKEEIKAKAKEPVIKEPEVEEENLPMIEEPIIEQEINEEEPITENESIFDIDENELDENNSIFDEDEDLNFDDDDQEEEIDYSLFDDIDDQEEEFDLEDDDQDDSSDFYNSDDYSDFDSGLEEFEDEEESEFEFDDLDDDNLDFDDDDVSEFEDEGDFSFNGLGKAKDKSNKKAEKKAKKANKANKANKNGKGQNKTKKDKSNKNPKQKKEKNKDQSGKEKKGFDINNAVNTASNIVDLTDQTATLVQNVVPASRGIKLSNDSSSNNVNSQNNNSTNNNNDGVNIPLVVGGIALTGLVGLGVYKLVTSDKKSKGKGLRGTQLS